MWSDSGTRCVDGGYHAHRVRPKCFAPGRGEMWIPLCTYGYRFETLLLPQRRTVYVSILVTQNATSVFVAFDVSFSDPRDHHS